MTEKELTRSKETVQCPLCGFKFSQKEASAACNACIFRKRCSLIICPRCGSEFPFNVE